MQLLCNIENYCKGVICAIQLFYMMKVTQRATCQIGGNPRDTAEKPKNESKVKTISIGTILTMPFVGVG